jgi:hypothetical protein
MVRDMDGVSCVWASDHEQMFFGIFCWRQWNVWKILFDTHDKIFGDMKKYFATCSWIKYIKGWNFGWQMTMDELFMNVGNIRFFVKNWTKKVGWTTFMLVYFEIFDTQNIKFIFQIIFCIYSIWSILNSTTYKPYRMLN